jgi:DNA-directed RNA polymerase subunit RPC12/RpoP
MRLRALAVLALVLDAQAAVAQTAGANASPRRDSVASSTSVNATSHADSLYMAVLEKTNHQLSLWWNPYGVMVGTLGVLFAMLATAAAIIIYRQGKEYRAILDAELSKYKAILDHFIEDKNAQIEAVKKDAEARIGELESSLENAQGEEEKKRIASDIETLKKQLESLRPQPPPLSPFAPSPQEPNLFARYLLQYSKSSLHTCSNCGRVFVPAAGLGLVRSETAKLPVNCPYCGHEEWV